MSHGGPISNVSYRRNYDERSKQIMDDFAVKYEELIKP